ALMKAQRQSFADLYISAQPLCLYDDKAVRSRGNRDMYFILSNSLAGNRTRLWRRALGNCHFSNGGSRRAHVCLGHFRDFITASWCSRRPFRVGIILKIGNRVGSLLVAFVEVQKRVEFRLAGYQLLQPLLVLEGSVRL